MTMERNAKAEALTEYAGLTAGRTTYRSVAPSQIAKYGRYLPAAVAAPFALNSTRRPRSRSRRSWATARIMFRDATYSRRQAV